MTYPEVKVCGLTRHEDARAAAEAGAAYLGAVFAPGGRRTVTPEAARVIFGDLPARRVGVFVDASLNELEAAGRAAGLHVLQLHGDETPELAAELRARGWTVWKALRPRTGGELAAEAPRWAGAVDALLLDGFSTAARGGTGASFPWIEVAAHRDAVPDGVALIAAGGLRPENVAEAAGILHPDVVDVSSGVESAPGIKDADSIRRFVSAARSPFPIPRSPAVPMSQAAPAAREERAGRFGEYGGRFVPETLITALDELEEVYAAAAADPAFWDELQALWRDFVGRPTPLYRARRLGEAAGADVWLKREDLNHTGAHKINNSLGQVLLARRMGKERIIAETGAGQHGVATATACALFGLRCIVYMGEEDVQRQALNVYRMKLLGAEVRPVSSGTRTLKDATNEAIRDWVTNVADTHYIIGSVVGPDPYPRMVRDFQSIIGRETREQMLAVEGRLPAAVVACVGGGSNAIGMFHPFVGDDEVELVGVEAAGDGLHTQRHAATLTLGKPGVLHGCLSYLLQDDAGQVAPAHSVSAGLDYPGVGPEHSALKDRGRATYAAVTDAEALDAFGRLARLEGIIPALETAHAIAYVLREGAKWADKGPVVICLSGRGDKDVAQVAAMGAGEVR